jgi:hypothetical protein
MRLITFIATLALALPAYAISVTNIDKQPHQLTVQETSNSHYTRSIAPDETLHLPVSKALIGLQTAPDQAIRVDYLDRLVIWPEGKLQIQMRRKTSANH